MFPNKLKYYRRIVRQMSLYGLSYLTGIAESTIDKYEKGSLRPKTKDLIRLANALEIPTYELI